MPYYVYNISTNLENNVKKLSHLGTFDKYKDAKKIAREGRKELTDNANEDCRLIFAKTEIEAEKLLSAPRETRVIGED